jgi:hypothetical protein
VRKERLGLGLGSGISHSWDVSLRAGAVVWGREAMLRGPCWGGRLRGAPWAGQWISVRGHSLQSGQKPVIATLTFLFLLYSACWDRHQQAVTPPAPRGPSVCLLVPSDTGRGKLRQAHLAFM